MPAAMPCPPPCCSRPCWRAAITAAPRSKPRIERAEPLAIPSATPSTTTGRWCRSASRLATMPTMPGCQPAPAASSSGSPAASCGSTARCGRVQHAALDRLPLGVERVELARQLRPPRRRHRWSSRRAPRSERPIRPPALIRGPRTKPNWRASLTAARPAASASAARPGDPGAARHLEALMDEGAVEAGERDHVADGAERDEVEPLQQRRLGPRGEGAPIAQHAGDGHQHDEGDADGGQMLERARLVDPVGVDHGQGRRAAPPRRRDGRSTITSSPMLGGLAQRLEGGGAGVQRDHQPAAAVGELGQDAGIRPVAVAHPVGDLDLDRDAQRAQVARHQGGRGGTVDVVVADQADPLAGQHGAAPAGRRPGRDRAGARGRAASRAAAD